MRSPQFSPVSRHTSDIGSVLNLSCSRVYLHPVVRRVIDGVPDRPVMTEIVLTSEGHRSRQMQVVGTTHLYVEVIQL